MIISLDRRTRHDADLRFVSPDLFFGSMFANLAAHNGRIAADAIRELGAPPLSIEVEDATWTVMHDGDSVTAAPGAAQGALIVTLSSAQFSDWAQGQMSLNGFLVARALAFRNGGLTEVSIWDSIWTALLDGWRVVGDVPNFVDRHGAPLDLARIFTPADDRRDVVHFLAETGYLHLRGWIDPADTTRISAEMDAVLPLAVEGDGRSWWAQLADGTRRCVRLQHFAERSPTTARILAGERWADMVSLIAGADGLVPGQHVEALVKPVSVVAGPSDVSFHRDCHLGRHAYVCARRTIGIAITPTGGDNGSLRVIAGSHRLAMPVAIETEAGDLTVHLSCTLHESTPPQHSERRVMYIEVPLAARAGDLPPNTTVDQILREQITDIHRKSVGKAEMAD